MRHDRSTDFIKTMGEFFGLISNFLGVLLMVNFNVYAPQRLKHPPR